MSDLRTAAQQGLDAIYRWHMTDGETDDLMPAFEALRAALAQPAWSDGMSNTEALPPNFDLYCDVIARLRFEPLTRTQQHAELDRVARAALAQPAAQLEQLLADARMLRNLLKNAQTAICTHEAQGWSGGTSCGQAVEALHDTRYLRA